jgi:hypothetical protein
MRKTPVEVRVVQKDNIADQVARNDIQQAPATKRF